MIRTLKKAQKQTKKSNPIDSDSDEKDVDDNDEIDDVDGIVKNGESDADTSLKLRGDASKIIAIDCEMVGGIDESSMLARVTVVNEALECVFDTHVAPTRPVVDFRTKVSGVRAEDLRDAPSFVGVQRFVANLIKHRVIVGHSLEFDLAALRLKHPAHSVRDTAHYRPLMRNAKASESLKVLAARHLGLEIQAGEHDPLEDARVALQLYQLYADEWEANIKNLKALRQKRLLERERVVRRANQIRKQRRHDKRKANAAAAAAADDDDNDDDDVASNSR